MADVNLGTLVVRLAGDSRQFDRMMSGAESRLVQAGRSFSHLGRALSLTVSGPLTAFATYAVKASGKVDASFAALKERFNQTTIQIGNRLAPAFNGLITHIDKAIKVWDNLSDRQQKNALTLGLVAAAMGPVSSVLGIMLGLLGTITSLTFGWAGALALIPTAMLLINDAFLSTFTGFNSGILDAITKSKEFSDVWEKLGDIFSHKSTQTSKTELGPWVTIKRQKSLFQLWEDEEDSRGAMLDAQLLAQARKHGRAAPAKDETGKVPEKKGIVEALSGRVDAALKVMGLPGVDEIKRKIQHFQDSFFGGKEGTPNKVSNAIDKHATVSTAFNLRRFNFAGFGIGQHGLHKQEVTDTGVQQAVNQVQKTLDARLPAPTGSSGSSSGAAEARLKSLRGAEKNPEATLRQALADELLRKSGTPVAGSAARFKSLRDAEMAGPGMFDRMIALQKVREGISDTKGIGGATVLNRNGGKLRIGDAGEVFTGKPEWVEDLIDAMGMGDLRDELADMHGTIKERLRVGLR